MRVQNATRLSIAATLELAPEPRGEGSRYNDNVESISGIHCAFLSREVSLESSRAPPDRSVGTVNTRDCVVRLERKADPRLAAAPAAAHTEIS